MTIQKRHQLGIQGPDNSWTSSTLLLRTVPPTRLAFKQCESITPKGMPIVKQLVIAFLCWQKLHCEQHYILYLRMRISN